MVDSTRTDWLLGAIAFRQRKHRISRSGSAVASAIRNVEITAMKSIGRKQAMRILIVDADPEFVNIVQRLMNQCGHQAGFASNGLECVACSRWHPVNVADSKATEEAVFSHPTR